MEKNMSENLDEPDEQDKLAILSRELSFLKDKVLAVLVFGSSLEGRGRDVDVCIVRVEEGANLKEILKEIFRKVDVYGKKYDIWFFEELPLYMKMEIIENHKVIFCKDLPELYEYFYQFRKVWKDQEKRNKLSEEDILKILS